MFGRVGARLQRGRGEGESLSPRVCSNFSLAQPRIHRHQSPGLDWKMSCCEGRLYGNWCHSRGARQQGSSWPIEGSWRPCAYWALECEAHAPSNRGRNPWLQPYGDAWRSGVELRGRPQPISSHDPQATHNGSRATMTTPPTLRVPTKPQQLQTIVVLAL
jgi:hypothetical protein